MSSFRPPAVWSSYLLVVLERARGGGGVGGVLQTLKANCGPVFAFRGKTDLCFSYLAAEERNERLVTRSPLKMEENNKALGTRMSEHLFRF